MKTQDLTPIILISTFFSFFLLLTPLGVFNDWVPPSIHTGFYSIDNIDRGDDWGYYAYLRSMFFDGDIDFSNERFYAHHQHFNSTGYAFNNWQIGQSFLVFPFFLLGHFGAHILNVLGFPVAPDGYSFPYNMSTALASQTYLFLGLLISFQINRKYFAEVPSVLATLCVWIASPLIYYTFIRQRMAHTVEFFLASFFVLVWLNNRQSSDYWKHALMGGILGFLGSVRILGLGLAVIYMVDQFWLLKQSNFKKLPIRCLIYFKVAVLICFSIQLFSWQIIEGYPLPMHNVEHNLGFGVASIMKFFSNVGVFLLGYKWGLLYSSPIILFGVLGVIFFKKLEGVRWPIIMAFLAYGTLVSYYVNNLASYQFRYLTPLYPLFGLGLGYFFSEASKYKLWKIFSILLASIFLVSQYFILIQYKIVFPYQDPHLTVKALSNILTIISDKYELLSRSTNFFKLITLDIDFNWTYKEYAYFLCYPLIQLFLVVIAYQFFFRFKKIIGTLNGRKAKAACLVVFFIAISIDFFLIVSNPEKTKDEIKNRKNYKKFYRQGKKVGSRGDIDAALLAFKKAIDSAPYLWEAKFQMALFLNFKGEIEKSNKYYQDVLRLNPHQHNAKYNLAINFDKLAEYNQAEELLRSAIKDNPVNPKPYASLAQLLFKRKKVTEAEFFFRRTILLSPKPESAFYNYAIFLNNLKRYKEAEHYFMQAISLNPKRGVAHLNLALLMTKAKRYNEAIKHLKIAFDSGVKGPKIMGLMNFYGIKAYEISKRD